MLRNQYPLNQPIYNSKKLTKITLSVNQTKIEKEQRMETIGSSHHERLPKLNKIHQNGQIRKVVGLKNNS